MLRAILVSLISLINTLSVGQEIEAQIVDFNEDDKKISLSMKALAAPEDEGETAVEE